MTTNKELYEAYQKSQEDLKKLTESVMKMHSELFSQCMSNPVINSWGYNVDLSSLNDCYQIAYTIDKGFKNE